MAHKNVQLGFASCLFHEEPFSHIPIAIAAIASYATP